MFSIKDVIGWVGSVAVVKVKGGCWLVDWANGKRLFVAE